MASRKRFSFPSNIFRPPTRSWREKCECSLTSEESGAIALVTAHVCQDLTCSSIREPSITHHTHERKKICGTAVVYFIQTVIFCLYWHSILTYLIADRWDFHGFHFQFRLLHFSEQIYSMFMEGASSFIYNVKHLQKVVSLKVEMEGCVSKSVNRGC